MGGAQGADLEFPETLPAFVQFGGGFIFSRAGFDGRDRVSGWRAGGFVGPG